MNQNKKLMLWFLIVNLLCVPCVQADSSSNIVWEDYLPVVSLTAVVGVYIYSLLSECQDLKNQSQCRYWEKDFIDNLKVYYPQDNSYSIMNFFYVDDIQLMANETKIPVLVIAESHVKHISDNIDLLFDQAKLLAPCIIYIEKDMTRFTALPFYDFNEFIDDSTGVFRSSCSKLVHQVNKLQEIDNSIIILGIGQGYDRQSVYDLCNFSFSIQYEKPSYKERVEFLKLLFAHRSCNNICIEKLAKRTISFSYHDLMHLVQKAENLACFWQSDCIEKSHIDKVFASIIETHEIYKYITKKSFYKTCVHEMGHAVLAAIFDEDFLLYNATSTPQSSVDDPSDGIALGLTWFNSYCDNDNPVLYKERMIMVYLAGKIAEHVFFGLSSGDILNNKNGYDDFISNPGGATYDLQKARSLAQEISEIHQVDSTQLLKKLYEKTLEIVISYKDAIEEGASILEQNEFITGSQVYNLLA